ncbi:MAG: hypothetical protein OXI46_06270 [Gemmatimonadota bacterium]|nr:hypothetical protein [Gemmatimonadota bacterium]
MKALNFGERVAEEERDDLIHYFVATDLWNRLVNGEIDIVYGAKGSGKSALYTLLIANNSELFDRNILLVTAENPRGAPAFQGLIPDPPTTEDEFRGLWKLYLATLIDSVCRDYGIKTSAGDALHTALANAKLIPADKRLASMLRTVAEYVKGAMRPESVGIEVTIDSLSGLPAGFAGKITFHEPSSEARKRGFQSVDSILRLADSVLSETDMRVWVVLDRLDVAFAESPDLEKHALRALFTVYLDLLAYECIVLKIFLRSDIWSRITSEGFREASHITRHSTISWDRLSLMKLIAERAVQCREFCEFYGTDPTTVRRLSNEQEKLFYRMCPSQVDIGPNKAKTFEWILGRTRDGSGDNAPRELIHFMNSLRNEQVRRLDAGEALPEAEMLFGRASFKNALPEVSRVRLEQTLYAESPALKEHLEKLRGEKTRQTGSSLAALWECTEAEAHQIARTAVEVGFFEARGDKNSPDYWVPFLYRDALGLVQGTADTA